MNIWFQDMFIEMQWGVRCNEDILELQCTDLGDFAFFDINWGLSWGYVDVDISLR